MSFNNSVPSSVQTGQSEPTRKTLLTVSGAIPPDIKSQIAEGRRPRADYLELARGLQADILDYTKAQLIAGRWAWIFGRLVGANFILAYACWRLRKRYCSILTDGEQVGLPLAAFMKFTPGFKPAHFMIAHVVSVPKKALIIDLLRLQNQISGFIVYCTWQQTFIQKRWRVKAARILLTPFMVDDRFFAADKIESRPPVRPVICSVGIERRDYPTLLKAVDGLDLDVVIAAASPWSKRSDSTNNRSIPRNVRVCKLDQYTLRQLYADTRFVVMPLEPVFFQAGVTAILEAMAMGKAVICSRVPGQTDVIVDDQNGCYVEAGDPSALREEIVGLLNDPERASRIGAKARQLVEREMNLDSYVERVAKFVRSCAR